MSKPVSKLDRLTALLKKDAPPPPTTMTQAQSDKLRPVMTAIIFKARIGAAYKGFHESNNPLYLLEGCVAAHRAGQPTPDWIMEALVPAFERFMKSRGKTTLDTALGFTRKRGSRTWWTARDQRVRDEQIKWLLEKRQPAVNALLQAETHPEMREWLTTSMGKPTVEGVDGASAHAIKILYPDGDLTGAKQDSLLQRYRKKLKPHS